MLLLLCLPLKSSFVSVVFAFSASLNDFAPLSPMLLAVDVMRMKKGWIVYKCNLRVCELFYLHHSDRVLRALCLISMRHPMLSLLFLRFYCLLIYEIGKECLSMGTICVLFLLFSHPRLSWVRIVFDFNASISDSISVSSILLPVDLLRMDNNVLLMVSICVELFYCPHMLNRAVRVLCLSSMLHSVQSSHYCWSFRLNLFNIL